MFSYYIKLLLVEPEILDSVLRGCVRVSKSMKSVTHIIYLMPVIKEEVMKKRNEEKAQLLYDFLDQSKLFKGTVRKADRSLMNVPFVTGDKELDAKFIAEATANGLVNLKGHRTVGGMRASIYNAMPYAGVEKLVQFMDTFEKENG